MLVQVVSASPSLKPEARHLLVPPRTPVPRQRAVGEQDERHASPTWSSNRREGEQDDGYAGDAASLVDGAAGVHDGGSGGGYAEAVLLARLEQDVVDVSRLEAVLVTHSAQLALGLTRTHLHLILQHSDEPSGTSTTPSHHVNQNLWEASGQTMGSSGILPRRESGGMVSLNCIETVREEKAGRLQVRLRQTCMRHQDVDSVLAELDVADFEEHALGNLLRQLSVASAQRQAEHSAAAVAGRANALALQEENGDGRSEVAGAPMTHGDGEPHGMNTPEAGQLQRSRVRLLHLAKIAIQRQMAAASDTVVFSQTWAAFNWSAPPGPGGSSARESSSSVHGQVGIVDEEELAPLFDVMGGEVSVSVVCLRLRVRWYGCGGTGAWICSHSRLRRA